MKRRTPQEVADFFGIYITQNERPNEVPQYRWFKTKPRTMRSNAGGCWSTKHANGYPWFGNIFGVTLIEPFTGNWEDSLHEPRIPCLYCGNSGRIVKPFTDYLGFVRAYYEKCPHCTNYED